MRELGFLIDSKESRVDISTATSLASQQHTSTFQPLLRKSSPRICSFISEFTISSTIDRFSFYSRTIATAFVTHFTRARSQSSESHLVTMFTFNHIITTVTLILFYVGAANGFWRMTCFSASGIQRMDPIVEPDTPSSHVHTIKGSDGKSIHFNIQGRQALCFNFPSPTFSTTWC